MTVIRGFAIGALALAVLAGCNKPEAPKSAGVYNPRQTFAPFQMPSPVNSYRGPDGAPGPDYWQNRADYKIAARLDPASAGLSGEETITYTNNSPVALSALWVLLDENIYAKDARAHFAAGNSRRATPQTTDGFVLDAVEIGEGSQAVKADTVVSDTRMQVRLPEAVKAKGGQIKLHIRYHYTVPRAAAGAPVMTPPRMARSSTSPNGIRAWRCSTICAAGTRCPISSSEFYLEYGDFDYAVTVPWDMLVAGSGELVNPQEVLTEAERQRMAQATPERQDGDDPRRRGNRRPRQPPQAGRHADLAVPYGQYPRRRFQRQQGFRLGRGADQPAGRQDRAGPIGLSGGRRGDKGWGRSTEYLKHAVENFSRRWAPYPWPSPPAWAARSTAWNIPAPYSTATRTKVPSSSGSPRTRSAIAGFR